MVFCVLYFHEYLQSVALCWLLQLPVEMIQQDAQVEIEILGELRKAKLIDRVLFDADGKISRG